MFFGKKTLEFLLSLNLIIFFFLFLLLSDFLVNECLSFSFFKLCLILDQFFALILNGLQISINFSSHSTDFLFCFSFASGLSICFYLHLGSDKSLFFLK
jgi:hypothetical protein